MATFTDVYKQELKSKGVLSSLGSAALKRTRERLDPRNILFGGSGMIAATGQKIFGKGYQAIQRTAPTGQKLADSGVMQTQALTSLIESSKSQEAILRIVAKNTSNNNAMARDINVMRQNIMKLVTMGGGTASRGADMFFKDAAAREASFESQFGKEKPSTFTTPTPVTKKEEGGGILSKILSGLSVAATGIIGKILTGISGAFSPIIAAITSMGKLLTAVFSPLSELAKTGLRLAFDVGGKVVTGAVGSIGTLLRMAAPLLLNPAVLGTLGVAGISWLIYKLMKSDTGGEASTAGMTSSEAAQAYGPEGPQPRANVGMEGLPTLDESIANAKRMREQRELELENKRLMSKGTPQRLDSGRSAMDPRRTDLQSTTPTNISTDSDGAFKSRDDFLTKMYPLAVRAAEKLGGIDPNALLTQWGFESAWGKKVSGKYNYFGIKADKSWTGEKKDVMTTEYLNGEKVNLPQPFRSYSSPEEAVDDYVTFLKKNKRYEKAGVFQSKTSGEFFSALQRAGYATDPRYAEKLTSATEGTGRRIASLMESSSELRTAMAVQPAPTVVVNAPSTTTVAAGGRPPAVASATNVDALELFAKVSVGA